MARAVKYYYKDTLKKKFAEWCEDLKREAEKKSNIGATGKGAVEMIGEYRNSCH